MSTGWYPYDKFAPGDGDDVEPEEETILNTDQLIERMQADELEDDDSPLITPVNYSKIRPFSSQQIFYHIRAKHLVVEVCQCGRRCINKAKADAYFRSTGKLKDESE